MSDTAHALVLFSTATAVLNIISVVAATMTRHRYQRALSELPVAIRPGPRSIPAGECPGGVVVHVYDLGGVLLATSAIDGQNIEAAARDALERVDDLGVGSVILIAYDGNDGHRMTARDLTDEP
jgi:hypothetical protein